MVAAVGLLAVPGTALGKFLPFGEDYGPGVTVTGAGFARVAAPGRPSERSIERAVEAAQPTAVARAVRDARRRAAAIAAAAGVQLGELARVELEDTFQRFGQPAERCRRARRGGLPRCRVPAFTVSAATVTFGIVGGADSEGTRTVAAYGVASALVEPENPRGDRSIGRALLAARLTVTPAAARSARRNVETAARSAGLGLGRLVSISEQREPYFYDPALGSFGPGQFCGLVRRAIVRRDPITGERRVVRRVRRRRCYFPRTFSLRLEATYEAR